MQPVLTGLQMPSFKETGANALNFTGSSYSGSNLRLAFGGALKFSDRNQEGSFYITPLIFLGYVYELPLHRSPFQAKFKEMTVPFTTRGWDCSWQLLNLKFGFEMSDHCFSLETSYSGDISPDGNTPYKNHRAGMQCGWSF